MHIAFFIRKKTPRSYNITTKIKYPFAILSLSVLFSKFKYRSFSQKSSIPHEVGSKNYSIGSCCVANEPRKFSEKNEGVSLFKRV
jgi:hypothetical protein